MSRQPSNFHTNVTSPLFLLKVTRFCSPLLHHYHTFLSMSHHPHLLILSLSYITSPPCLQVIQNGASAGGALLVLPYSVYYDQ